LESQLVQTFCCPSRPGFFWFAPTWCLLRDFLLVWVWGLFFFSVGVPVYPSSVTVFLRDPNPKTFVGNTAVKPPFPPLFHRPYAPPPYSLRVHPPLGRFFDCCPPQPVSVPSVSVSVFPPPLFGISGRKAALFCFLAIPYFGQEVGFYNCRRSPLCPSPSPQGEPFSPPRGKPPPPLPKPNTLTPQNFSGLILFFVVSSWSPGTPVLSLVYSFPLKSRFF